MSELVLDAVTVSRGAGPVISDVSLRVAGGEVLALVGPNGAGKTSLIESVSGVTPHSAGTITLDGEPIDRLSRVTRARRGIVHIEQGRAVFPSLTVRENLSLTARTPSEFDAVLAQFPELEKRIDAPTALLSGGEQQMVVLARAFAAKPRILLIDEMSLGLAPVVFLRLMPIVQSIAESGVGVLLVEQFTQLALGLAEEAVVVAGGRVSFQGTAQALQEDPALLHRAYLGG
ncbi:ATP-binding cassette domain-containing protein [Microbacterium oxydans]|uniref:High-affinity branched-chain amino acid transport ATP-binding protein LivF n=1 Tax=Microbacterium oxydans TaxID=82380 RepID=A0A3Q9J415_9MICO|nr:MULTISPECIES: ATP-binding cassette domain-containing protein [Microbacterium]AZS39852.1 High-affinity branched-chain amino acid transport ATP-binding protein LivF [Microbacterium oxydans]KAB1889322.1 ATP-binding cassette domain-containing protein [Microbacterium oxydans]MBE7956147.1 ATP-binding cassette domain-containing protein [Microbacterium sp. R1]GED39667.1 ABC transporter ATP-binding protein [Microbacterium oxydans]